VTGRTPPAYHPRVPRTVTLVLVDGDGALLGALPPFDVELPYWQEMSDVVLGAQERYGVTLEVLRLLTTEQARPHGGAVSYLAEVTGAPPSGLEPIDPSAVPPAERQDAHRPAYAQPGGPARSLAWARTIVGPVAAVQQRTWNLSAIWKLGGARRTYWLKQLPSFYPHEAVALGWLGETMPELVPRVLGLGTEGRELLADVAGYDLYLADLRTRLSIAEAAHRFQLEARPAADHLVERGIPDRRGAALTRWIRSSLAGWVDGHRAAGLLDTLDDRMTAIADCGLPDTLAHGDAHPGNVRGHGDQLVFLDWSDSFIGHPGFDILGLVDGTAIPEEEVVLDAWTAGWRRDVPGCSPRRAAELLRPVAYLRSAAVYAEFVANIEVTERRYHSFDVPAMLNAALAAANTSP
jgi:hypothetical protein